MKLSPLCISACLLLFQAAVVNALNLQGKQVAELETIVTTGTRTPKLLADSPVSINVIQGRALQVVSSGTLAQALNFIPGVVVKRSFKEGYNVSMQGFDSDHVLVLVNGMSLVSPTGSSADLDQISARDIERIEIMRGAGSVMYGSAAMGGVINIITREPENAPLSLTYEQGSYSANALEEDPLEHRVSLASGWRNTHSGGRLSASFIDNPGFDYDAESVKENGIASEKQFLDGEFFTGLAGLKWIYQPHYFKENKQRRLDNIRILGNDPDTGNFGTLNLNNFYKSDVERIQQDIIVKNDPSNWVIHARHQLHHEESGQTRDVARETNIEQLNLDSQKIWMLQNLELATGVVVNHERFDQYKPTSSEPEIDNKTRQSLEGYVQGDSFIGSNFEVLYGLRSQEDSDFGNHSAMRVSGMWRYITPQGLESKIRIGLGESYRVPNLKERFYAFDHSALGYKVVGNDDLVPEEAVTFNLGYSIRTPLDLLLEINTYFTQGNNFIVTQYNSELTALESEGVAVSQYQNEAKVEIKGVDISLEMPFLDRQIKPQLNYSYVDARNDDGIRLEEKPYHQAKFNLWWQYPSLKLDVMFYVAYEADEYVSTQYAAEAKNEWTTFNLKLSQQLTSAWQWRAGIENIFDEHEDENNAIQNTFDSRPKDSRRIYLGLKYDL